MLNEIKRMQELAGIINENQEPNKIVIDPKDITNIEFMDVDWNDHPDFSDAYVYSADHADGTPYTEEELDALNDDADLVHELLIDYLN